VIRVVIADDHPMMRRALAEAVASALAAAVEVSEAGSFADAERLLSQGPPPTLLLLDLTMPGMSGFAGLAILRGAHPEIPIVIVSASEDPPLIRRAIEFGAAGYIPKSLPIGKIGEALRAVLAGDIWVPDSAVAVPVDHETAQLASRLAELTPQQLRVLTLVAEGKHNKQVAFEMDITEATVKFHLSQIFRKLAVQSRTQAVIAAQRMRLTGDSAGAGGASAGD